MWSYQQFRETLQAHHEVTVKMLLEEHRLFYLEHQWSLSRLMLMDFDFCQFSNLEAWAQSFTRATLWNCSFSRFASPVSSDFVGNNDCSEGLNLSGFDFRHADLTGCDFGGCDLTRTRFDHAFLGGACFDGAWLSQTCFVGANLKGASFHGAESDGGSDFSHALISGLQTDQPCQVQEIEKAAVYRKDHDFYISPATFRHTRLLPNNEPFILAGYQAEMVTGEVAT